MEVAVVSILNVEVSGYINCNSYISYILKLLNIIYQFNDSDKFDVVFVKNISLTYSA